MRRGPEENRSLIRQPKEPAEREPVDCPSGGWMQSRFSRARRAGLVCGVALASLMFAVAAEAQVRPVRVAAQPTDAALRDLARQTGVDILFTPGVVTGRSSPAVTGEMTAEEAARRLVAGSGLEVVRDAEGALVVRQRSAPVPQSAGAAPGAETTTIEDVIVTAQKREQRIQDVPIAISAFTAETLNEQKIEGGVDLVRAIPNVAFTKTNFTSYNFQIRGVGTQAVSATSDPGVAVAFNSTGVIQNRLFEQEYFDIERVEVLRGPQGTLYGRNATAGVINVISAKPDLNDFEGMVKAEVGNFDSRRLVATVNLPLIEDRLAVRLAGSTTQRDGYDYNSVTGNDVNGRDLWGARLTVGFQPTSRFRVNLIWERFEEDDNRSRTGKQLCHRDTPPEMIGGTPVADGSVIGGMEMDLARAALFSTGCRAGSLYDDDAFGTPNGASIPFVLSSWTTSGSFPWGYINNPNPAPNAPAWEGAGGLLQVRDPYGGLMQSRDMREIASIRDPIYRAQNDTFQLNVEIDLNDSLTFNSQTLYVEDGVYSFQDANRFTTVPFFNDTSLYVDNPAWPAHTQSNFKDVAPGGIFCDPQIGCSDTIAGFDISRADGKQFTQEFRLSSFLDGPLNFSIGANYTEFETLNQYYVMNNVLTALAMSLPFNGSGSITECGVGEFGGGLGVSIPMEETVHCPYIDPNPVESINGDGHNYFRSVNPYDLTSMAAFGELYWNASDTLRVTAGLRYTKDTKTFDVVPSQLLLAPQLLAGGIVARGYPVRDTIELEWGEWTGRLGADWRPNLGFTDDTLLYAFFSRGYKGGGMNPPLPDFAPSEEYAQYIDPFLYDVYVSIGFLPVLSLIGEEYGKTFEPEFVNAFEIGSKNALMNGAMTFNATAFYYDYTDYQVSQIRDRSAVNENFDATVWGVEFETVWEPTENLRLNANLGYLRTRIADGETSIDIMNRNQGDPNYTVVRAWSQIPSNCVIPTAVAESHLADPNVQGIQYFWRMCGGYGALGSLGGKPIDPATSLPYDVANYPELNDGSGLVADLSGNELPNAPRWTFNLGAQYGHDFGPDWRVTVRGDFYWQHQSFHRVYNYLPYDRLEGWTNTNLSIWAERGDGLRIEAYVKNVFDETPITGAFLNSDDSGLTTNVFTSDPRIIGISIRQDF
jgi:outer membrane receptor protein involved in Fe transport